MGKVVQDEAGQLFVDQGGGTLTPVSEAQALAYQKGEGAGAGIVGGVAQGTENLLTGAMSLLSDNPYWMNKNQEGRAASEALNLQSPVVNAAAQFAPQAGAGIATAGAGLLPAAAAEAALGAATTPEAPIQGAIIGGALGAAGELAPGAAQWLGQRGRAAMDRLPFMGRASPLEEVPFNPGGMRAGERPPVDPFGRPAEPAGGGATTTAPSPGVAPSSPSMNPPGQPPNPAPRMADRVGATLQQADEAMGGVPSTGDYRVMEGTMSPQALYDLGIPTSPAQRALLEARGAPAGAAAREALAKEEAQMSHPLFGQRGRNIRDAQQQGATNFLARELEIPQGINLTDPVLADVTANIGGRLDDIAGEMGAIPITPDVRREFADILQQTTGSHKKQLQALVDEIEAKSTNNSGVLTGNDWQEMRTKINNMIEAGTRQGSIGKVSDAGALMDTMTAMMEAGLPDATRAELASLRKRYAIASTLQKAGARNADGQVNPLSFYNQWKRPQSKTRKGTDDVGSFMNTMVTLGQKRTPDSGTAGRLMSAGAGIAADVIPGGNLLRRATGL